MTYVTAVFEKTRLADLSADHIEAYLRDQLKQRVQVKTGKGVIEEDLLKATTVHQEFRGLRRMLK